MSALDPLDPYAGNFLTAGLGPILTPGAGLAVAH